MPRSLRRRGFSFCAMQTRIDNSGFATRLCIGSSGKGFPRQTKRTQRPATRAFEASVPRPAFPDQVGTRSTSLILGDGAFLCALKRLQEYS
jgi:hypothetical protein